MIALGFTVAAAVSAAQRWEPAAIRIRPGLLVAAVVPLLIGYLAQAAVWTHLLERMSGLRLRWLPAIAVHVASQLGKYVPGKVGLPALRIAGAPRIGAPATVVGASVFVEALAWLSTGIGISVAVASGAGTLHEIADVGTELGIATAAAAGVGVLALMVVDRRHFPAFVRRWLRLEGSGALLPWAVPFGEIAWWGAIWAHGFLLLLAAGADLSTALAVAPLFALALLGGFLALPVPAGMGVREAVLVLGLQGSMGAPAAVAIAIVSRLLTIAAELILWGVSAALARRVAPGSGTAPPVPPADSPAA